MVKKKEEGTQRWGTGEATANGEEDKPNSDEATAKEAPSVSSISNYNPQFLSEKKVQFLHDLGDAIKAARGFQPLRANKKTIEHGTAMRLASSGCPCYMGIGDSELSAGIHTQTKKHHRCRLPLRDAEGIEANPLVDTNRFKAKCLGQLCLMFCYPDDGVGMKAGNVEILMQISNATQRGIQCVIVAGDFNIKRQDIY